LAQRLRRFKALFEKKRSKNLFNEKPYRVFSTKSFGVPFTKRHEQILPPANFFLKICGALNEVQLLLHFILIRVLILLYLSYGSIWEFFDKKNILDKKIKISYKNSFLTGFVINGSNPLALLSWLGFYGFIRATSAYNFDSLTLLSNLICVIICGIICGLVRCSLVHAERKLVNENSMRYVSLAAGVCYLSD